MAANNQGIVHLITAPGNDWMPPKIACRNRLAHMAVTSSQFSTEPRKCKRCETKWMMWEAKRAAK